MCQCAISCDAHCNVTYSPALAVCVQDWDSKQSGTDHSGWPQGKLLMKETMSDTLLLELISALEAHECSVVRVCRTITKRVYVFSHLLLRRYHLVLEANLTS